MTNTKLQCIWRDGCNQSEACQAAECCQGLRSNREKAEQAPSNSLSIKPCPFCGSEINQESEESWYFFGEGPPPGYTVRCDSCGAQGPYGYGKFRKDHAGGQADAVKRWNELARTAHEPPAVPSKFDLAFEVIRLMDREEMDTLQSCHFGYVLRVEREKHTPPPGEG